MKKGSPFLLILLILWQPLWSVEAKFYGFIYKYPVTMQLDIGNDNKLVGHYFYDKQQKKIAIQGELKGEDKKLFLKTDNGSESFVGYLLNYKEQENNRIIGRWNYKNKELPFEFQKQRFTAEDDRYYQKTGLHINPIADNYLQKEEIEVFTKLVFEHCIWEVYGSNQIQFDAHPNALDKTNQTRIVELTEEVRSQAGRYYGYNSTVDRNFLADLLRLCHNPKEILKNFTGDSPFDKYSQNANNYFTRWSFASVYNFNLYKEFKKEEAKLKKELIAFYKQKKFSQAQANYLADYTEYQIRNKAYGSSASADYKENSKLLQKIVAGDEAASIVAEIDSDKYDNDELFLCLNAAILLKRETKIIQKLLKNVENIDSFEESPLSSAVQNLQTLKFLLKDKELRLDVNHKNPFGKTPLFYAIQYNQHEAARLLLEKGADVNQKYASAAEIENILEYPKEIYHTQRTPLMHAAQHADVKMLGLLLEKKSHLEDLDEVGFNALDYAIYGENKENVAFLQSLNLTTNKSAHQFRKRIAYW